MCTQHRSATHLTQQDRFHIEATREQYSSLRAMGRALDIGFSTLSREIARNKDSQGRYCAETAQKYADQRRRESKHGSRKIENDLALAQLIEEGLRGDDAEHGNWSPEVLANTTLKDRVTHVSIYAWIKRTRHDLRKLLPHQGRRRIKYGAKTARARARAATMPSIDLRPPEVELRKDPGHYEGDTVVVRGGRIHTLAERTSRFLIADLITSTGVGLAMQISESAVCKLSLLPETHRRTITYDRGSEFSWWDQTEKHLPNLKVYFAHPYHPWERGTNERINGLLRRYIPKKKLSITITREIVARVVWRLNHRPRKILHWRTPCEVFGQCCTSTCN